MRMDKVQKDLAKVIENYFGADAGYLDIDCFTLARRIMEAGWTKPVRCKDCDYRKRRVCAMPYAGMWVGVELKDSDFCSYGKRRADG
jgi:hypothetical protein